MLRTPDLAPWAARRVNVALPPPGRVPLSSVASIPGKSAGTDSITGPGAPLAMFTSADSPAFSWTAVLSSRISLYRKSAEVGMLVSDGGAPAPFSGNGPGFILPQGVLSRASWSTYQYHLPFSS